jgi:hypothetical protein
MSARRRCFGGLLGNMRREFLVNDRLRQRLLDQSIGEACHRNPLRLGAEIEPCNEVTPELRGIPFCSGHRLIKIAAIRERAERCDGRATTRSSKAYNANQATVAGGAQEYRPSLAAVVGNR